ncbi:MAG: type VI secretion system tip protein TssI/VgrG [Polyangiaceae bacterium]
MHLELHDAAYQLDDWSITSISGVEAVNEPFLFTIELRHAPVDHPADVDTLAHDLLGVAATFSMHVAGVPRSGIVTAVELAPGDCALPLVLKLEIRPHTHVATLRKNTQSFQAMHLHDVVSRVLSTAGVPHRLALHRTYKRRPYTTQYEETDWQFVTRLLAEAGVYWYYEHVEEHVGRGDPIPEPPDIVVAAGVALGIGGGAGAAAGPAAGGSAQFAGGSNAQAGQANMFADMVFSTLEEEPEDPRSRIFEGRGPSISHPCDVLVIRDDGYDDMTETGAAGEDAPAERFRSTRHRGTARLDPLHYEAPIHAMAGLSTATEPAPQRDELYWVESSAPSGAEPRAPRAIRAVVARRAAAVQRVEIRDRDYRKPLQIHKAESSLHEAPALAAQALLEVYEHHGEYDKPDLTADLAGATLEQHRRRARIVSGASDCPRLLPGHKVHWLRTPRTFEEGDYTPVRVTHSAYCEVNSGAQSGAPGYANTFEWVAADVAYRPEPPERLRAAAPETAVVVGPPGKPLFVDRLGRVKVQFHWDRQGRYDERSSYWLRVVQPWAGTGFGFQFFPRVGMEVVVAFVGGDPDRPFVMGALYNATHPLPFVLPEQLGKSGLRTQSIPTGDGFNELSFDDTQGCERVFLHAQKDLEEIVTDTHSTTVLGDRRERVVGTLESDVEGARLAVSGGDATELVGGASVIRVEGRRIVDVAQNLDEHVGGSASREVDGVSFERVKRERHRAVGGDATEIVFGDASLEVGQGAPTARRLATFVQGSVLTTATERIELTTLTDKDGATVRLSCGASFLELTKDTITLSSDKVVIRAAKTVDLHADDKLTLGRKTEELSFSDEGVASSALTKLKLETQSTSFVLEKDSATLKAANAATVQSPAVKLDSGSANASASDASEESSEPKTETLKLALHHGLLPFKKTRFELTLRAQVFAGETDDDGLADLTVPSDLLKEERGTLVLFVDQVAPDDRLFDAPLVWSVKLVDELAALESAEGTRQRLLNLGYPASPRAIEPPLEKKGAQAALASDAANVAALALYQRDQGLAPSGELIQGGATEKALDPTTYRS